MLVMEYLEFGCLFKILRNPTIVLDGDLILPIIRDVAQGVRFLHAASPQIVHGDLKSHNVLVDGKFRAKVADFGFSKKRRRVCGTPLWMAPELLRGEALNNPTTDAYAFGVILCEIYSRGMPYGGVVSF